MKYSKVDHCTGNSKKLQKYCVMLYEAQKFIQNEYFMYYFHVESSLLNCRTCAYFCNKHGKSLKKAEKMIIY